MNLPSKLSLSLIVSLTASFIVVVLDFVNSVMPEYFKLDFWGITIVDFVSISLVLPIVISVFLKFKSNKIQSKDSEIEILKANEKYRKEFIGNVSHELKTPIFNIQGYVVTLLDGAVEDSQINMKYLERAEKNINRMISIVEDLNVISKIESGVLNLEFNDFDIVSLINEVIEMVQFKNHENFIDFVIINQNSVVNVCADKEKITQVLVNLLTNSIKYGKKNGITKIRIRDIRNKIFIDVADSGIGISERDLPRIFERFYRVDKSRSQNLGGTGLGLSIVKHIIEAHQEKIFVDSRINIGTVFTFSLKKAK